MNEGHVLLVEDNQSDERLTLRALKKAAVAHPIEVVRDGQQALDYLFAEGEFAARAGGPLPVVVLLDLNLPRVSGLEVLARLRADARTRLLPIVVLTSSDEARDRAAAYASGANSFVSKPVVFEEFAEQIGRVGVYWTRTNVQP